MADDVTTTLAEVAAVAARGRRGAATGQGRMAESVGRSMAEHRHLVVQAGTGTGKSLAYLVPAALVRPTGGGGHRHQGPPGPAGPQRPSPGGGDRRRGVHLRRAQGSQQLPLPPAGGRDRRPGRADGTPRPTGPRRPTPTTRSPPTRRVGGDRHGGRRRSPADPDAVGHLGEQVTTAGAVGRHHDHRGPGRARVRAPLPGLGGRLDLGPRVPGGLPLPVGPGRASPRMPGPGPPRPMWWWSTPTCTGPIWPAEGPCSRPTRWWCSTRPTKSRRS